MLPLGRALAFLVFFIFYLLLGGYLFNIIECPDEMARRNIHHTSAQIECIDSASMDSICEHYHDPRLPEQANECEVWSFYNSVFFAFTSITTIGYGRTAPQTQLGRGVLMIYSFIGIPINGILIGTIGAFFSIKVQIINELECA